MWTPFLLSYPVLLKTASPTVSHASPVPHLLKSLDPLTSPHSAPFLAIPGLGEVIVAGEFAVETVVETIITVATKASRGVKR